MERITINFSRETCQKLKQRAEKNSGQPLAQCIRELVDLALQQEALSENGSENSVSGMLSELRSLLRKNMDWSLESRFLGRFLVANQQGLDDVKKNEVLNEYREKAENYVSSLVKDHG